MEPTAALRSIETRLRLVLTELSGDSWIDELSPGQKRRLETWRANDVEKRGVHVATEDLAAFTMTGELGRLILARWDIFEPIFRDKDEFKWLLLAVENVRNTIAHSRELLPYERDLLSGAAGKINHLVALHRASAGDADAYYPRIERISDSLGLRWRDGRPSLQAEPRLIRVDVGTMITMQFSSTPVRGKTLRWELRRTGGSLSWSIYGPPDSVVESPSGEFTYTIESRDVGEVFGLSVSLHTNSQHRRYTGSSGYDGFDDLRQVAVSVNPDD